MFLGVTPRLVARQSPRIRRSERSTCRSQGTGRSFHTASTLSRRSRWQFRCVKAVFHQRQDAHDRQVGQQSDHQCRKCAASLVSSVLTKRLQEDQPELESKVIPFPRHRRPAESGNLRGGCVRSVRPIAGAQTRVPCLLNTVVACLVSEQGEQILCCLRPTLRMTTPAELCTI